MVDDCCLLLQLLPSDEQKAAMKRLVHSLRLVPNGAAAGQSQAGTQVATQAATQVSACASWPSMLYPLRMPLQLDTAAAVESACCALGEHTTSSTTLSQELEKHLQGLVLPAAVICLVRVAWLLRVSLKLVW